MSSEFIWQLLRKVVAQLTWQIGFSSATQPALEILTDLLDERLSSICIDTKRYAELDQRTDPHLRDLNAALMRRNVSFSDILDYVNEVEPIPLMVDVPRFPACPQKIREQLVMTENGGTIGDQNEIMHTETEDGSQTTLVPHAVNGMASGPVTGLEKKSFLNETGAPPTKRARLQPDEALHSQHVMASFAMTDSGHVPIKRCLKATAAYAPPSPKRPRIATPTLPVYYNEPKHVENNFLLEESILHQHKLIQPTHFPKKAKHTSRETGLKPMKPKKMKLQKHSIPSRIKLPKPKKEDKMFVKKAKTLSKKAIKATQFLMQTMLPLDIVKVEDVSSSAFDQELQKSRISSYEDSINAVINNIVPDKMKYETTDLNVPSPLPPIAKPDSKGSEDNFYLDIDVPLDSSQLSQLAAERDAHINDTIDGVIAQSSSLDDDLRMSPETGESDVELEPRQLQSAVVDRFDVSSVPSPQIPQTWQMLEEEVEEEVVVMFDKDEFKIAQPEISNVLNKQKSKKSKSRTLEWPVANIVVEPQIKTEEKDKKSSFRASEWPPFNTEAVPPHMKIEEKQKKSKHRSSERLPFDLDLDPAASRDAEEWDRKSRQLEDQQLLDLSRGSRKAPDELERKSKHRFVDRLPSNYEPLVSRSVDELEKKSKHRSIDRQLLDLSPYVSRTGDESDKKSKHRTVDRQPADLKLLGYSITDELEKKSKHRSVERHDLDPFVHIAADEADFKPRHRMTDGLVADTIAPSRKDVGDRDKRKHRSQDRVAFIPNPEPPKDVERWSADSPVFSTNKALIASATEFPRVSLTPVPLPFEALPSAFAPSLSTDTDFVGQPPLKRIKIVTSAGDINQFEIKPMKARHKKKDKKSKRVKVHDRSRSHKDRERSHDHKDRAKSHDRKDREDSSDFADMDKLRKEDYSKKDTLADEQSLLDFSLVSNKSLLDWNRKGKHRSDGQSHGRDASLGKTVDDSEKKWRHRVDRQPLEINAFARKTVGELEKKSRSDRGDYKEDSERPRSREPKRKDKSREDRSESRKDEKQKERSDKSLERNDHKKDKSHKKEDKQNKEEILSVPAAPLVPAVPKLTLKFSKMSSGTPSVVKSSEPEHLPEPEQLPEHGAGVRFSSPIKPIKLRFKGGLAGLATAVELAPPFTFPNEKTETQPKPRSPLEVPTFSPSPESICIPSPHSSFGWCSDELEKPTAIRGRATVRTPTPPSLSIPAPIISKPRLPSRSSLSPSPHRSLSPPTLFKSQDVDRQAPVFSALTRRLGNTPSSTSVNAKSDLRNLQKVDVTSKVSTNVKTPPSSRLPSSSKSARSSSKSVAHMKGMPPSTVMPPATPVQSLLPLVSKSVGGSSKTKKRVTTETVNTIVDIYSKALPVKPLSKRTDLREEQKEDEEILGKCWRSRKPDGTTVWYCPDCREEADEWSIGCDKCDDWYHWSCVGIAVAPPEEEKWFCRRCVGQSHDPLKTPISGKGRGKKTKK